MLPVGMPHVLKDAASSQLVPFSSLMAGADTSGVADDLLLRGWSVHEPSHWGVPVALLLTSAALVGMDPSSSTRGPSPMKLLRHSSRFSGALP